MVRRTTGYYCWIGMRKFWHSTFDGAVRRIDRNPWMREYHQVIDAATGELVYGRAQ